MKWSLKPGRFFGIAGQAHFTFPAPPACINWRATGECGAPIPLSP